MPVVPQYERRVEADALPGVRVAPDVATPNVAASFQGARESADLAVKMATKAKQEADDAWTKQSYAELIRQKNNLLHGDGGALRRQGVDAQAAVGETEAAFEKYASELESKANNETQRQIFSQMRMREGADLRGTLMNHAGRETERIKDQSDKTIIEAYSDDSILNPPNAEANLAMLVGTAEAPGLIDDIAARKGWTPEMVDAEKGKVRSQVHGGIVMSMLRRDDDLAAKAYFDKNKDAITDAQIRGQVEQGLEEGGLRGESQRRVDWLLTQFQDLGPAREWIRSNLEGKLRDEVDRRARDEYGLRSSQVRQAQEGAFVSGYNYLEKNGKLPPVGSPEWTSMSPAQRESLKRLSSKRGEASDDDPKVMARFMGMSPAKLAGMTEAQIIDQAAPNLTRGSFNRVLTLWRDAREAMAGGRGSKKDLEVKSIFSDKEMVLNALKSSKVVNERVTMGTLDNDEETARLFRDFADKVDDQFQQLQREGKKLGDDEKKAIIGRMLTQKVFVDGWTNYEKPTALLTDDERKNVYVPIGNIPQNKLKILINTARANGVLGDEVTDERAHVLLKDRLERAYGAAMTGADDASINLILGGAR